MRSPRRQHRIAVVAPVALTLVVTAAVLHPTLAWAWNSTAKWAIHKVHYRINPANQDVSNADAITAVRYAAQQWTNQSQAAFHFVYDGTSSSTTIDYNGQNLVLFRNAYGTTQTTHATTYTWRVGTEIVEADMVFWDKAVTYIVRGTSCTTEFFIEDVGIHEFGHALGLDHVTNTAATMYGHSSACTTKRMTLAGDDIAGVEALYPCSTNSQCGDGRLCTTDTCQGSLCDRTWIAGCCTTNSQCGDGNDCTTDTCQNNSCVNSTISGCCTANSQCGDGNACTTDRCVDNACTHSAIAGCCTANSQCGDGDACTTDRCVDNACVHTPVADCCTADSQCEDGDPCTADTCQQNACRSDPVAGCCTQAAQCDDGDPCTTDVCVQNVCQSAPNADCEAPDGGLADGGLADGGLADGGLSDSGTADGGDATPLSDGGAPSLDASASADAGSQPPVHENPRVLGGCACTAAAGGGLPGLGMVWMLLFGIGLEIRRRRLRRHAQEAREPNAPADR